MRSIPHLLSPLLLGLPLTVSVRAQTRTVGSVQAASVLGVRMQHGRASNFAFVGKGSKQQWAGRDISLRASASIGPGRYGSTISARLSRARNKIATASLEASGSLKVSSLPASMATTSTTAGSGPVSVLFVHPFSKGITRDFTLQFTPRWSGAANSILSATVDVGNDSSIDWRPTVRNGVTQRTKMRLSAGPKGIVIRLTLRASQFASSTGSISFRANLSYQFLSGQISCKLAPYGTSCGPQLVGSLSTAFGPLKLKSSGARAKSIGLWILGLKRISARIPGTNCILQTSLDVVQGHAFDAAGTASLRVPIPSSLRGILNWQDAVLTPSASGLRVQTTQALQLSCQEG